MKQSDDTRKTPWPALSQAQRERKAGKPERSARREHPEPQPERSTAPQHRVDSRVEYQPRRPRGQPMATDHRAHAPRGPLPRRHAAPADAADEAMPRIQRERELRLFGVNACLAVFRHRPGGIRKIYLRRELMPRFGEVLSWCAQQRIGYRLVENEDLERLTQTQHHEGVCFDTERPQPLALDAFLPSQNGGGPSLLLLLDGVGNPHNFGALLRSAAHFGVAGVLLPPGTELALSGAACRVAEGGAEKVPLVAMGDPLRAVGTLQRAGYTLLSTVVDDGEDLYASPLPARAVIVFGAEGSGVSRAWRQLAPRGITVPGTGAVESLNIATTVGVIAAEHWRRHRTAT